MTSRLVYLVLGLLLHDCLSFVFQATGYRSLPPTPIRKWLSPTPRCSPEPVGDYVGRPWLRSRLFMSLEGDSEDFSLRAVYERTREEIQGLVSSHNIILFMKGNRLMPQCGFSNTVVQILQSLSVPFETVDVLADDRIRQGIKDFSNWPTIPQLYLGGEFVGGADIVLELFQSGELQEMIEVAAAS